jgi:DNA-binding Lrp family transcriptional regulator
MNNQEKIIKHLQKNEQATPHQITDFLGISYQMVHRYLKKLVESGVLEKLGKPPRVFYRIKKQETVIMETVENRDHTQIIQNNFTLITPDGKELEGVAGFVIWCKQRNFDIQKKAQEFFNTIQQYEQYQKNGIIDATIKIDQTFVNKNRFLDRLYFLYPYSLPVFGKTKIATWLFHGKQTENTDLMKRVFERVIPELHKIMKQGKYDAVGFIPPSVPRKIQFMKELQKKLMITIPLIHIEKIKNAIIIQFLINFLIFFSNGFFWYKSSVLPFP